jgi:hypothetical protein
LGHVAGSELAALFERGQPGGIVVVGNPAAKADEDLLEMQHSGNG